MMATLKTLLACEPVRSLFRVAREQNRRSDLGDEAIEVLRLATRRDRTHDVCAYLRAQTVSYLENL